MFHFFHLFAVLNDPEKQGHETISVYENCTKTTSHSRLQFVTMDWKLSSYCHAKNVMQISILPTVPEVG
jgi:hypothetical protein